jgi:hypothetical protein
MPSSKYEFAVKGVSGFWRSTAIGLAKYPNTDIVSSVSSKAENLVPKRIGQLSAGIVSIIQLAAPIVGVSGAPDEPLESFRVSVPDADSTGDINSTWHYDLKFDNSPPRGTVSLATFIQETKGRKVGFWPVPACRPMTLTVKKTGSKRAYEFHFVVATADNIRLVPLPIDGKSDLGSICGSSTSGTLKADELENAKADLKALQEGVQAVRAAVPTGASSPNQQKSD